MLNASESTDAMRKLLTQDYVSALTYEHFLAGSVTMSFTLSSLVYLVAMYPEVEEKLLKEIDAFGPKDVVPNVEDIQTKFPYMEQVSWIQNMSQVLKTKYYFSYDSISKLYISCLLICWAYKCDLVSFVN